TSLSPGLSSLRYAVSIFNNRVLFSFHENIYVFSLRTRTWTLWRSDAWGPIGQVMSTLIEGDSGEAYALPSSDIGSVVETEDRRNLVPNSSFEIDTWGWVTAGVGGNISRSTDQHNTGEACLAVTAVSAGPIGMFLGTNTTGEGAGVPVTEGVEYTAS